MFSVYGLTDCFPSRVKANREQAKCVLGNYYFVFLKKFQSVKHFVIAEKSNSTDSNSQKEKWNFGSKFIQIKLSYKHKNKFTPLITTSKTCKLKQTADSNVIFNFNELNIIKTP